MTEVTRVACPGCRALLRFEPEALDFPAYCGACECRFTAGVYVRVTCPACRCGSKIREGYRGRRVRCVRCRHDFLADEGIPPGAGGRLLVARMLDSDLPETPETIQPFLGHARAPAEPKSPDPAKARVEEAERLKARALVDRDRLAREIGLVKAILARLVGTSTDPEALDLARLIADRALSTAVAGPDEAAAGGLAEERDRLDLLVGGLKAELEVAREEFEEDRERLALAASAARRSAEEAEGRAKSAEETLARETLGFQGPARDASGLVQDHVDQLGDTKRERAAPSTTIDRLNQAVLSARAGEHEALGRLEDLARRLGDSDAENAAERRRSLELGKVVGELKREIGSIREAEAAKALEVADERSTERRRALDLDRLVEELRAEIEVSREAVAERSSSHEAELAERTRNLEEAKRGLVADLERSRAEAERLEAENERLAEAVDRLLDENQQGNETTERLRAENRRMSAEVKAARASRPDDQGPRASSVLEAVKAEAARREESLVAEIRRLKEENETLSAAQDAVEIIRRTLHSMPPATTRAIELSASEAPLSMRFAGPGDVWGPHGSIENGPPIPTEAASVVVDGREVDLREDLAATLLYGANSVDGEAVPADGR